MGHPAGRKPSAPTRSICHVTLHVLRGGPARRHRRRNRLRRPCPPACSTGRHPSPAALSQAGMERLARPPAQRPALRRSDPRSHRVAVPGAAMRQQGWAGPAARAGSTRRQARGVAAADPLAPAGAYRRPATRPARRQWLPSRAGRLRRRCGRMVRSRPRRPAARGARPGPDRRAPSHPVQAAQPRATVAQPRATEVGRRATVARCQALLAGGRTLLAGGRTLLAGPLRRLGRWWLGPRHPWVLYPLAARRPGAGRVARPGADPVPSCAPRNSHPSGRAGPGRPLPGRVSPGRSPGAPSPGRSADNQPDPARCHRLRLPGRTGLQCCHWRNRPRHRQAAHSPGGCWPGHRPSRPHRRRGQPPTRAADYQVPHPPRRRSLSATPGPRPPAGPRRARSPRLIRRPVPGLS
jgi:hypothetical protein